MRRVVAFLVLMVGASCFGVYWCCRDIPTQPSTTRQALSVKVIKVMRSETEVRAEVDAGTRDGLKDGDRLTIGRGGDFIANLRVVNPESNRATGIVTLESAERGLVRVGDTAYWYPTR